MNRWRPPYLSNQNEWLPPQEPSNSHMYTPLLWHLYLKLGSAPYKIKIKNGKITSLTVVIKQTEEVKLRGGGWGGVGWGAHKRFKRKLFIKTRQNQPIFGVNPFVIMSSYKTTLNSWTVKFFQTLDRKTMAWPKTDKWFSFSLNFHCFWQFSCCLCHFVILIPQNLLVLSCSNK